MAAATNAQVQQFVNDRVRPRCEQIRNLYLACKDDTSAFGDVYENLNAGGDKEGPWSDGRADAPPHLMTPSDVLAWNTFIQGFIKLVEGTFSEKEASQQFPVVLQCCVRPVS